MNGVIELGGCLLSCCFGEDGVGGGVSEMFQPPLDILFSIDPDRSESFVH